MDATTKRPEPWPSQQDEANEIERRPFFFVAADMGTGKTGATLLGLEKSDKILVVCPIAVGPAWVKQIGIWDPTREACLVVDGPTAKRAERVAQAGKRSAVIVNYDAVWRGELGKQIAKCQWDAIVLDESHRIKSPSGRSSRWLAKLAEKQPQAKRLCLSGTPCPHSPLDWWSQWRFLSPEILGKSYTSFRARIANTHPRYPGFVLNFRDDALAALSKRIDDHVYRIKADDVVKLPDLTHCEIKVRLPQPAKRFYEQIEDELVATLDSGETITAANKLVLVNRLQQATSGFTKTEDGKTLQVCDENPKADALREWLTDLPPNEPVVIFVKFIHDIDVCLSILQETGRTASELSGRKKSLADWQRGDTVGLVVQQQAGGVGVDLVRSAYAVYYSLSHSLGDFEQSLARLRRPGQTRPCRFYHLVAEGTVDETVYQSLKDKKDVVESVMDRLTARKGNRNDRD